MNTPLVTFARFPVTLPIVRWISKFRDIRSKSQTETVLDFGHNQVDGVSFSVTFPIVAGFQNFVICAQNPKWKRLWILDIGP